MSLLDDLLNKVHLPPSHLPTVSNIAHLVGALVAYAEHGDELLKAAEEDVKAIEHGEPTHHIDDLLSPPPVEEPAPAVDVATTPAASPSVSPAATTPAAAAEDPRDAEIAALKEQLALAEANKQRTSATFTTSEPAPVTTSEPAPEPPAAI